MIKKILEAIKDAFFKKIGLTVVDLLGTVLTGSVILAFLYSVKGFLSQEISLPIWLFLLIVIMPIGLFIVIRFLYKKYKKPKYCKYITDVFENIKWEWRYSDDQIENLKPFCVTDSCQLTNEYRHYSNTSRLSCPSCDGFLIVDGNYISLIEKVKKLIEQKIRNGTYPKN